MADVEQMLKIVSFGQNVCGLMFGVDVLDLNLEIQINLSNNQSSNSVGSRYVSQSRTSAFDDHFDHDFVVLKNKQHRTKSRRFRIRRNMINIVQIKIVVLDWNLRLVSGARRVSSYLIFRVVELV